MSNAKRFGLVVLALVIVGLLAPTALAKPRTPKAPSAADIKKVTDAVPAAATVKPAKARKVLVFWKCSGFFHSSIPLGNELFKIMGSKTGAYTADVSQDMAVFTADNLKQYDAIVLNNTTRLKFTPEQQKAIMDFIRVEGKGLMGVHGASDNFYDWPEAAKMLGGQFGGHPWGAGGTWAMKIDDPTHPLNKGFAGKGFKIKDEIYQMVGKYYSRDNVRVLISLDMTDKATGSKKGRRDKTDKDYAVSWLRAEGKGRIFYSGLGHNNSVFQTKAVVQHFLDGLQYVLGDLPADATPSAKLTTAARPAKACCSAAN